jgi:hypothetical protein
MITQIKIFIAERFISWSFDLLPNEGEGSNIKRALAKMFISLYDEKASQ